MTLHPECLSNTTSKRPLGFFLHSPRSPTPIQRYSTHFIWHLVALEVGRGEDLVAAAAKVLKLEDAGSSIVLELEGAGDGEGGEEEKRKAGSEESDGMHLVTVMICVGCLKYLADWGRTMDLELGSAYLLGEAGKDLISITTKGLVGTVMKP